MYPTPTPVQVVNEVSTDAYTPTWVIVLQALKNILAIITYLAVLYTLYQLFTTIADMQARLHSVGLG